MIKLLSGSIMCIFLLITSLAHSADYPDHPVNILTMTKPGAQIDLLTRALAEQLKKTWDQPVIVSNNRLLKNYISDSTLQEFQFSSNVESVSCGSA